MADGAFPIVSDCRSTFGGTGIRRGAPHAGVDIIAPVGTPVIAAADGEVISSHRHGKGGELVSLRHGDTGIRTLYIHLNHRFVRKGDRVRRGQVIGTSGQTGSRAGPYPHLHFEMYIRDPKDPRYPDLVAGGTSDRDGVWSLNPHSFYVDGPGRVTLFERGTTYPADALLITYPVPARKDLAHYAREVASLTPVNQKEGVDLSGMSDC